MWRPWHHPTAGGRRCRRVAQLRDQRIAGDDAFAVGARVTVPLHRHEVGEVMAVIDAQRLRVSELSSRVPNLDDVYLKFTGGQLSEAA